MEALQIDREADEGPLAPRLDLTAETEPPEAEHLFDPAEDGLDDRFPASIPLPTVLAGEARGHALRRLVIGVGRLTRLAFRAQ